MIRCSNGPFPKLTEYMHLFDVIFEKLKGSKYIRCPPYPAPSASCTCFVSSHPAMSFRGQKGCKHYCLIDSSRRPLQRLGIVQLESGTCRLDVSSDNKVLSCRTYSVLYTKDKERERSGAEGAQIEHDLQIDYAQKKQSLYPKAD